MSAPTIIRDPANGDWIRGYTAAIMDIAFHLPQTIYDLSFSHKKPSEKFIKEFMQVYIDNRAALREGRGFIRVHRSDNTLEWFEGVE